MLVPDVNIFLNAQFQHQVHHRPALEWLEEYAWGREPIGTPDIVFSGFVRIATGRTVSPNPVLPVDAFAFCSRYRSATATMRLAEGPHHWAIFERLVLETGVSGPHVADAYLAAFAIENNATFVTFDKGFARFPGLNLLELGA